MRPEMNNLQLIQKQLKQLIHNQAKQQPTTLSRSRPETLLQSPTALINSPVELRKKSVRLTASKEGSVTNYEESSFRVSSRQGHQRKQGSAASGHKGRFVQQHGAQGIVATSEQMTKTKASDLSSLQRGQQASKEDHSSMQASDRKYFETLRSPIPTIRDKELLPLTAKVTSTLFSPDGERRVGPTMIRVGKLRKSSETRLGSSGLPQDAIDKHTSNSRCSSIRNACLIRSEPSQDSLPDQEPNYSRNEKQGKAKSYSVYQKPFTEQRPFLESENRKRSNQLEPLSHSAFKDGNDQGKDLLLTKESGQATIQLPGVALIELKKHSRGGIKLDEEAVRVKRKSRSRHSKHSRERDHDNERTRDKDDGQKRERRSKRRTDSITVQSTEDREARKLRQQKRREQQAARASERNKDGDGQDHEKVRSRRRRHARHSQTNVNGDSSGSENKDTEAADTTSKKRRRFILRKKQFNAKKASTILTDSTQQLEKSTKSRRRRRSTQARIDDSPPRQQIKSDLAQIEEGENKFTQQSPERIRREKKRVRESIKMVEKRSTSNPTEESNLEPQPATTMSVEKSNLQQEKDLMILQKCFNRSLERMHKGYEGSTIFGQGPNGKQSPGPNKTGNMWLSPRLGNQQQGVENTPPIGMSGQASLDNDQIVLSSLSIEQAKPKTSFGLTRDKNIGSPQKDAMKPIGIEKAADFSNRVNALRDSLHTSQKDSRRSYLVHQTPTSSNGVQSPRQSATGVNSTGHYVPHFSPQQIQMMSKCDTSQSSTLRQSIQSPAKQHRFRKELKLPSEHEQHQLILVESAATQEDLKSSRTMLSHSREVTLKAVKMSQPSTNAEETYTVAPMPTNEDEHKKLKIITTQIPQSLLITNSNNSGLRETDQNFFMRQTGSTPYGYKGVKPSQVKQATSIIQGYLLPASQAKGQTHLKQHSMPPSLTAINVQQMARDLNITSTVFTPKPPVTQRRVPKKKQSNADAGNSQQMKLARRQIQFYQKRQAEHHIKARTPKNDFVTRRVLFKRRARMCEQNLLIFYFDGVLGELCSRTTSYGQFKVRQGTFQGLRKLFTQHQIAIFIPYVKNRAKVIACYIDKFQGCPVDAIYCVQQGYLHDHCDLKFIDYSQIYKDFDLALDEKLIDKCLIVAPRTKEVSATVQQPQQNLGETVYQSVRMSYEKNDAEENQEEQRLMQTYLMNKELEMPHRVSVFQFQGCPANLSSQLEPQKKKVNYLASNDESPSASARRDSTTNQDKLTPTQANKIAVDLGQMQKPVTLLVPHTKTHGGAPMYSFQPIIKVIEALAILDEHSKARTETPLIMSSLDSGGPSNPKTTLSSINGQPFPQQECHTSCQSAIEAARAKNKGILAEQELEQYSMVDAFYAFKTILAGSNCCIHSSLLKRLYAVETKKVQTSLYRDQMLGRVLLEKAEIKKCYQFTQMKHNNVVDKTVVSSKTNYQQLILQNEYLKRYIQDYSIEYYRNVKEKMDEAKVIRMCAYFMNQFSQRLADNKEKTPSEHLKDMFYKEINYKRDLPSRNINLFKNHRFLILVKCTGTGIDLFKEDGPKQTSLETVDIQKIMGQSYFKQLESFRKEKSMVPDILPPDIVRILFNQRHTDCTDWFTKKAFTKPIQFLEKQQVVQERKELMNRQEQEKQNQQTSLSNKGQELSGVQGSSFYRSSTIEVGSRGAERNTTKGNSVDMLNFLSKKNSKAMTSMPSKFQSRQAATRGTKTDHFVQN